MIEFWAKGQECQYLYFTFPVVSLRPLMCHWSHLPCFHGLNPAGNWALQPFSPFLPPGWERRKKVEVKPHGLRVGYLKPHGLPEQHREREGAVVITTLKWVSYSAALTAAATGSRAVPPPRSARHPLVHLGMVSAVPNIPWAASTQLSCLWKLTPS